MKSTLFSLLAIFFFNPISSGQPRPFDFGIGTKIQYFLGLTKGSSNFSASLTFGITRSMAFGKRQRDYFQPAYQLALNMYANGLGANLLREHKVTEFDVVNSITITCGRRPKGKENEFLFDYKAFNQMTASFIQQDLGEYSATLGTSFVANNHKRNQNTGFAGLQFRHFRVGYYNDATPFEILRLVDFNDRWWTGGVFLQYGADLHLPDENEGKRRRWKFSLSYERFTGDVQEAYLVASRIGLPIVPAKSRKELFLNRALTSFTVEHDSGYGFSASLLGHSKVFDLQDYIHKNQGSAKHHSFAKNHWLIGAKFNGSLYQDTID